MKAEIAILGFILGTLMPPALGAAAIGRLTAAEALINGSPVHSTMTVLSESEIRTNGSPAFLYLETGHPLEIGAHSTVLLAAVGPATIRAEVMSGTVSYRGQDGIETAAAHAVLTFAAQKRTGRAVERPAQQSPVPASVVVLTAPGVAGAGELEVNQTDRLESGRRVLLVSPDETLQEIYFVFRLADRRVILSAALETSFPEGTRLIQDPEKVRDALAAAVATIGPAPISVAAAGAGGTNAWVVAALSSFFNVGVTTHIVAENQKAPRTVLICNDLPLEHYPIPCRLVKR